MSKLALDTVIWEEFKLNSLFELKLSKGDNQANLLEEGHIPLISSGLNTNGITKFVKNGDGKSIKFEKNTITIDMFGKAFYHDYSFFSVSHGRVNILIPKFTINKYIALFLITIIDNSFSNIFSYNRMCSQKRLNSTKIQLPTTPNGIPNWQFMEDYTKQELLKQSQKLIAFYENKSQELGLELNNDNPNWNEFKIKDLFKIKPVRGKAITQYSEGLVPYITTSSINNGLNNFIATTEDISIKKCISIDPIAGKAFFHNYDFVGRGGAGSAINLLYNNNLDKYSGLFICKAIENSSFFKASYGVQLNGNRLKNLRLLLPIDKDCKPHWAYMSTFVKKIEKENIEKIIDYMNIYSN